MTETPRPWHAGAMTPEGVRILAMQGPLPVSPATANGLDDAALIVRAVNSHDQLVEALEWMLRSLPFRRDAPDCHPLGLCGRAACEEIGCLCLKRDVIRAVLRRAKVGPGDDT